jgi:AraC-like DNA-binding protein
LETEIKKENNGVTFGSEVKQMILLNYQFDFPQLEEIAEKMHMTPRTLQRKLKEENSSFRQLLDSIKQELACNMLVNKRLSIAEIAYKLGYAEPLTEAGQSETLSVGRVVYLVVSGGANAATGGDRHRVTGLLTGSSAMGWTADFGSFRLPGEVTPVLAVEGVFLELAGASLTAQAFDTVLPGLGFWIVPIVAWMFAFSTIISWSYYGEQGMIYLLGQQSVMPYRIVYCLLILLTVILVETQDDLSLFMNLGTGVMLWANIPIMVIFGPMAMRAYHDYMSRLRTGVMEPAHTAPKLRQVLTGKDVD